MNYDLAKRLMDAGFPQTAEWSSGYWDFPERLDDPHFTGDPRYPDYEWNPEHAEKYKESYVYCPTLSELIEACGEGFYEMKREGAGFIAWNDCDGDGQIGGRGSTPEEAVANLWIALQESAKIK